MSYRFLIHSDTYQKIHDYRSKILADGIEVAGEIFQKQLLGLDISRLSNAEFLECLMVTKKTKMYTKMYYLREGWNKTELSILGDVGLAVPVDVFNNGNNDFYRQDHLPPIKGTLLFIPSASRSDGAEYVLDAQINIWAYQELYERRLLPLLLYANQEAHLQGKRAFITLPALGSEQFVDRNLGSIASHFKDALIALLKKHAHTLPHIAAVYYDPYEECQNERYKFNNVLLLVRPLMQGNRHKPQLCSPRYYEEADEHNWDVFFDCVLFSIMDWDRLTWPSHDSYGDRNIKLASTNAMSVITGIDGQYNSKYRIYKPHSDYRDWEEVVRTNNISLNVQENLQVLPPLELVSKGEAINNKKKLSYQLLRRGLLIENTSLGITLSDNALLRSRKPYGSTDIEFLKRILEILIIPYKSIIDDLGYNNILIQDQQLSDGQIKRLFPEINVFEEAGYNPNEGSYSMFANSYTPKISISDLEPYVALLVKGLSAAGCRTWCSCAGHINTNITSCWVSGTLNILWTKFLLGEASKAGIKNLKLEGDRLSLLDVYDINSQEDLSKARENAIQLGLFLYENRIRFRAIKKQFTEFIRLKRRTSSYFGDRNIDELAVFFEVD